MKKFLPRALSIILSAVLLMSFGICLNARNTKADVAYGNAVVDGKLDEAYMKTEITESIRAKVFMYPWDKTGGTPYTQANFPVRATSYFLWDEDYFYVCTIVKDAQVFERPLEYYSTPYPWEADSVNGYFVKGDEWFTLHTNAFGTMWYANDGTSNFGVNAWADLPAIGSYNAPNYTNMDCSSLFATTLTEDGYIVEIGLKLRDGAKYVAGDVIKYSLQINDVFDENADVGYAIGSQDPHNQGVTFTLAEPTDPVVTDAPTTDAPETDILDNPNVVTDDKGNAGEIVTDDSGENVTDDAGAAVTKPVETKPAGNTITGGNHSNKNPNTSDMGVVAAAAVLVSGLAFSVIKLTGKKKES